MHHFLIEAAIVALAVSPMYIGYLFVTDQATKKQISNIAPPTSYDYGHVTELQ